MTIRPIEQQDNAALAAVIRSVLAEFGANKPGTVYFDPTTDDLFEVFHAPLSRYFAAVQEATLVGGAGIYPTVGLPAGCCELVKLYLLPAARGRGFGRQLIETCFDAARELGYREVYLETMPELATAVGLYEKCGFRYLPAPMGSSGHFGCDIWMKKQL